MYTIQELEEKLSYETIIKMFYKSKNVRYIRNLIKKRCQEEMEVTSTEELEEDGESEFLYGGSSMHPDLTVFGFKEYIEEDLISKIRVEIIHSIIKNAENVEQGKKNNKGELIKPVDDIYKYAKTIVENCIKDIIAEHRRACEVRDIYIKNQPVVELPEEIDQEVHVFTLEQREKILEYLHALTEDEKYVIEKYVFDNMEISEIAEEMGIKPTEVSQIKKRAFIKIEKIENPSQKEKLIEAFVGLYGDISVAEEMFKQSSSILLLQNQSEGSQKINNPSFQEEEPMDSEYADMLFHTIYDVAKIQPISDMVDEYIMGRLKGEQEKILKEHLAHCNICRLGFTRRKIIISALKQILQNIKMN